MTLSIYQAVAMSVTMANNQVQKLKIISSNFLFKASFIANLKNYLP